MTKATIKLFIKLSIIITICLSISFIIISLLSNIITATILLIPILLLFLAGIVNDVIKYKASKDDIYGFISAIFVCSLLFWPSIIIALYTNVFTIILYCICLAFIVKLYTIFAHKENIL